MSATLSISKAIEGGNWKLTAVVTLGDIPTDVFMYENTGTGLGDYVGVCALSDYMRIQTHSPGTNVPLFGNKFLKFSTGIILVPLSSDPQVTIDKVIADVRAFRVSYQAAPGSSQVIVIT